MKCEGQSAVGCLLVFRNLNIKTRVKSWRVDKIYSIKTQYKVGSVPVTKTPQDPVIK